MSLRDKLRQIWSGGTWTDVIAEPGHRPEFTVRAYYELQRKGLRVRYRVIGTGGGPGAPLGSMAQTIKIEVHRDDLAAARAVVAGLR